MVVLLYKSGIPVDLTAEFSNLFFDIEGFLIEFTYQKNDIHFRYNYHFKSDFNDRDIKRTDLTDGYYVENEFLRYLEHSLIGNNSTPIPTCSDLIKYHKFDFSNYYAKATDSISVDVTNFDSPYELFYDRKRYAFSIENNVDGNGVRSYSEPILDGFEEIDYKLRLPSSFTPSIIPIPSQLNSAGYHFFKKNLGDFINTISSNEEKRKLKKIVILTIFKIRYIIKDIFPNLILNSGFTQDDVDNISNNPTIELSGDPENLLKELMFSLKKSWGYYYDANSSLPHKNSLPTFFNSFSQYSDYEYYYLGLRSFYDNTYKIPRELSLYSKKNKYYRIIHMLPINALSILPIDDVKNILLSYIKKGRVNEGTEQFIVRLVLSVANNNADNFLDFLIKKENGINTNFECIYNLLDDARIERIPVASWFADEKTNRMAFVYAVNELWKLSNYNLEGTNQEINEQSYFLNDGINYYKKDNNHLKSVVLECGRLSSVNSGNPAMPLQTNTWVDYETEKKLKKEFVTINKNVTITNLYLSSSGNYLGPAPSLDMNYKVPTDYHLYQPITLIGHQADDRVIVPNKSPIPAFLFYYSDDFERILKVDAQIALTVNIGIEVVLFFTLGGVTQLRHLQHLKYITKIRGALSGTIPVGEEVLVWAGLEAGTQTTSITASMIYSLGQYNAEILPTETERKAREEANKAFLYMTLAFAGGTAICRYKAVQAAEYALIDMAGTATMNPVVKSVMQTLVNQNVDAVLSFGDRITNLSLNEANVIITRYTSYSPELKKVFYRDFGHIKNTNTDFWNALNKVSSLDNYEELRNLNILERNEKIIFSSNNLTESYIKYYSDVDLRPVIERIRFEERIKFFNDFNEVSDDWFEILKAKPDAINRWKGLTNAGKEFAKQKPEKWLYVYDRMYENLEKGIRLLEADILNRFGQKGLDLVNEVESTALQYISSGVGVNQMKIRDILFSGMKDKVTGETSTFFRNFSGDDFNDNGVYDIFMNGIYENQSSSACFPNLKRKIDDIIAFKHKNNYNMQDLSYFGNTGLRPGAHAEIRALDDLAKKTFDANVPTDEVFDAWLKNNVLGYNRNIQGGVNQEKVIMHTCADCFHILDLVTFIKL